MNKKHVATVGLLGLLAAVGWWRFGGGEEDQAEVKEETVAVGEAPARKQAPQRGARQTPSFEVLLDDDPEGALRLEGQVVDSALQPVAGAQVSLGSMPPRQTKTAEDGSFYFDKLVGRPYRVAARTGDGFAGPVTVRLTDTNDPVILTLRDAARVDVTVRSASDGTVSPGARVELRSIAVAGGTSNDKGVATVRGIAPGRYRVMAVANGFAPDHSILPLPNDTKVPEHEVQLRNGAPVSGVVQTTDGKPVAGARVTYDGASSWAQSGDDRYDALITDAAGKFRFDALPQGLSLIHISEPTRPILVSRMPSSA